MNNCRYELSEIVNNIVNFSENKSKTLIIHSSFAKLLPPVNFTKWDALYTIYSLIEKGFTLALPSFTFSFCKKKFYSEDISKSETGILADWVFEYVEDSIRTKDPIYSFVVVGPKSNQFNNFKNDSCWGKGSIFEYFEDINAQILMLGTGFESVTQFHRYEELLKVPYREYKEFHGVAKFSNQSEKVKARMFVRDLHLDPNNNMNLIKEKLIKTKSYLEMKLFRGFAKIININDLSYITKKELKKNIYALLENSQLIKTKIINRKEANNQKELKIALLGFNNNQILFNKLKNNLEFFIPDRNFEIYVPEYGQFINEMIDINSKLNSSKTYIRIYTVNYSDFSNYKTDSEIEEFLARYVNSIINIHKAHKGWSIVNLFFNNYSKIDYQSMQESICKINKFNNYLIQKLSKVDSLLLVDPISTLDNKKIQINDSNLWYLGRFPFSNEFSQELTYEWTKLIISILNKAIRLIIIDLDNTIWGGVLGEEGIEGINIGGDYPGNAFYDFQKELVKLRSQGIALAISSKNDATIVKKTFNKLNEMPLKLNMFSAMSIGWHEKSLGIKEIANKLNLGLYSILFIDDNEAEIKKVTSNYPELKYLHLPKEPSELVNSLKSNPYIKNISTTREDINRIESLKILVNLKNLSKDKYDLNKYLIDLRIKVFFNKLSSANLNRAEQLCQKTNQFNSTSKRFTRDELDIMNKENKNVILIGHKSKDMNYENIGLMIIEENHKRLIATLNLYLLSCRVLGRGLEKSCIKWLANEYINKGFKKLNAELIKNDRNVPIHNIFEDIGFINTKELIWELSLKNKFLEPNHLEIYNELY